MYLDLNLKWTEGSSGLSLVEHSLQSSQIQIEHFQQQHTAICAQTILKPSICNVIKSIIMEYF